MSRLHRILTALLLTTSLTANVAVADDPSGWWGQDDNWQPETFTPTPAPPPDSCERQYVDVTMGAFQLWPEWGSEYGGLVRLRNQLAQRFERARALRDRKEMIRIHKEVRAIDPKIAALEAWARSIPETPVRFFGCTIGGGMEEARQFLINNPGERARWQSFRR